ncbi:MAG: hypothetical protein KAW17_11205 [Candidatus Eisenbacteria sp.]|nr:hypothetical protein [Candidatus Eisenbacteria bacterium]
MSDRMYGQFIRWLTVVFLYVSVASVVLVVSLLRPGVHVGKGTFVDMIHGEAHRPYVYRTLLPSLVRAVGDASEPILAARQVDRNDTVIAGLAHRILWRTKAPKSAFEHKYEYGVCFAIQFLCILGFGVLLKLLSDAVYPDFPGFVSILGPVIALSVIPPMFFRYGQYIYDPMTLFLFALCVYLILVRRHVAYVAVFTIAVFNKETAILLIPVFALRERGLIPWRRLVALTLLQALLYVCVKLWLAHLYRENPGSFVEFHLLDHNVKLVTNPEFYVRNLIVLVPIVTLITHRWKEKPVFLRHSLVACSIPLVTLATFLGFVDELRGYYELYPFVYLLALPTLVEVLGIGVVEKESR